MNDINDRRAPEEGLRVNDPLNRCDRPRDYAPTLLGFSPDRGRGEKSEVDPRACVHSSRFFLFHFDLLKFFSVGGRLRNSAERRFIMTDGW